MLATNVPPRQHPEAPAAHSAPPVNRLRQPVNHKYSVTVYVVSRRTFALEPSAVIVIAVSGSYWLLTLSLLLPFRHERRVASPRPAAAPFVWNSRSAAPSPTLQPRGPRARGERLSSSTRIFLRDEPLSRLRAIVPLRALGVSRGVRCAVPEVVEGALGRAARLLAVVVRRCAHFARPRPSVVRSAMRTTRPTSPPDAGAGAPSSPNSIAVRASPRSLRLHASAPGGRPRKTHPSVRAASPWIRENKSFEFFILDF